MKRLPILVLAVVPLTFSGCAARGPYHAAVTIEHDAASVTKAFQDAETIEFQAGRISPEEHKKLEALVEKVGLAGVALNNALSTGVQTSVTGSLDTFVKAVDELNTSGVLAIKNQTSQAVLTASLSALKALIANLQKEVVKTVKLSDVLEPNSVVYYHWPLETT